MRFYISDLHFFHRNLNVTLDCRGFEDVYIMNEYIIEKWNAKVRDCDEVVILGDVSAGTAEETNEVLRRLNGKLFLVKGNHDHFLGHRKFDKTIFEWVKPYAELRDNKRKVILSHYPILCYNGQYRLDDKEEPLTYMLYGHVHDSRDERMIDECIQLMENNQYQGPKEDEPHRIPCRMINCFCMFSDYTPLTLDEWIVVDEKRRKAMRS